MAYRGPVTTFTTYAREDLSDKKNTFVKWNATWTGVIAVTTAHESACGILQNAPKAGEPATVCPMGISKLVLIAATNPGIRLSTNAAGKGVASTTAAQIRAKVIVGTSAANGVGTVEVMTTLI